MRISLVLLCSILPALSSEVMIDCRDFGAAEGASDSLVAIQAAINYAWTNGGGTVLLSGAFSGGYSATNGLLLRPRVNLKGLGSGRSVVWTDTNSYPKSRWQYYGSGPAIAVTIDPGHTNILSYGPTFSRIDDLWISGTTNCSHGIQIGDWVDGHPPDDYTSGYGYGTTVENCTIVDCGVDGIHCSGAASVRLVKNEIVRAGRYGISTWTDANGMYFAGNHVQSCGSYGAYLNSFWGSAFIGNTVEGNNPSGGLAQMLVKQAQGSMITGCYFEGFETFGVTIGVDNHGLVIVGNISNVKRSLGSVFIDIADDGSTGNSNFVIEGNCSKEDCGPVVAFREEAFDNVGCRDFRIGPNRSEGTAPYVNTSKVRSLMLFQDGLKVNALESSAYSVVTNGLTVAKVGTDPSGKGFGAADYFQAPAFQMTYLGTVFAQASWDHVSQMAAFETGTSGVYLRNGGVGINNANPSSNVCDITGHIRASGNATIGGSVESSLGYYLFSPNGTKFHIQVDDSGVLHCVRQN